MFLSSTGMPYPDLQRYGLTMRVTRLPDSYHAPSRPPFLPSLIDHDVYQHLVRSTADYEDAGMTEDDSDEVDDEKKRVRAHRNLLRLMDGYDISREYTKSHMGYFTL